MPILLLFFAALVPSLAQADCIDANGKNHKPGGFIYNVDFNVMQYCAGTVWRSMLGSGSGGGGGLPSCADGDSLVVSGGSWVCDTPPTIIYGSCKATLDAGASTGDGLYNIDPDGGGVNVPFQAYCDMTTDGGGWTRIVEDSTTTLADLANFGSTSEISGTFYTNASYGIGWGTNDQAMKSINIADISFSEYKMTYSGWYNSPSGGLGIMCVQPTHPGNGWSCNGTGGFSMFLIDNNTSAGVGQSLQVNGTDIFSSSMQDVINRTDTISATTIFIGMGGFTSAYGYTRRYVNSLWVR